MSWMSDKIAVKNADDKGRGLFAVADIFKGELLVVTSGQVLTTKQVMNFPFPLHCFQIEYNLQLAPISMETMGGIFLCNHSCNPNCGIRNATSLVALHNINEGTEICYDYAMTDCTVENLPTVEMDCKCGSVLCRGLVTDQDWRSAELQTRYAGFFSKYLQEIIEEHI